MQSEQGLHRPGIREHARIPHAPDEQDAALGIREAADPTNELIPPSLLPFQALVFFHTVSSLMTGLMTDWGRIGDGALSVRPESAPHLRRAFTLLRHPPTTLRSSEITLPVQVRPMIVCPRALDFHASRRLARRPAVAPPPAPVVMKLRPLAAPASRREFLHTSALATGSLLFTRAASRAADAAKPANGRLQIEMDVVQ